MILPRQYYGSNYNCNYNSYNCSRSGWSSYGRWILLACVVAGALFFFFLFSCLSARRRRKNGHAPYAGTGWVLGRPPAGHGQMAFTSQPHYGNQAQPQQEQQQQPYYNNSNNPPPPPAYSPPPNNNNYYGNNQGIELQQPGATYQGGYNRGTEDHYAPPKDPPPRT